MSRFHSVLLVGALSLASASVGAAQPANCLGTGAAPGALGGPVRVGVTPPPPLPAEVQPPAPAYGYQWTPGYWGWNGELNDYYWVPGAWMAPPAVGLFWTPPWWQWDGAVFVFHGGYWGPTVGFYGGIPYGYGYFGRGYEGGYWQGRTFYYNSNYNNLGTLRVNAVYARRVADDRGGLARLRSSYNGGRGGVVAAPTPAELAAARQAHVFATVAQARHVAAAAADHTLRAGVNGGRPRPAAAIAATPRFAAPTHGVARLPAAPPERPAPARASPNHAPSHPAPGGHASPAHEHARPVHQLAPAIHREPALHEPAREYRPPAERPPPRSVAAPPRSAPPPQQHHAPAPPQPRGGPGDRPAR